MIGRDLITDRVAAWLEQRGQDPAPLRATVAAVQPEWSGAAAMATMLGSVTLAAGRRGTSATVTVLPGPAVAASTY